MADISFEIRPDNIGVVTFSRPEKRNAFDAGMRREFYSILRAPELHALKVVIVRAEGPSFCAGADLKEKHRADDLTQTSAGSDLLLQFRRTAPVLIASVRGGALGLGCGIAMACDVVIAADTAVFGYPEVPHGRVAAITMVGLQRIAPGRKALELLVTGRKVSAAEALSLGMVNEVVPEAEFEARSLTFAAQLNTFDRSALHATKRFFYEAADMSFDTGARSAERVIGEVRHAREQAR